MRWLLGLVACAPLAVAGCSPFGGGAFACADDGECSSGASAGVCEASGFCSFVDGTCNSGRRYGELAGGGLAGVCVGEEPGDPDAAVAVDADPNQPDADPTAPDAMVTDFCDPQAGLVACFKFENNVNDSSGNGNHATATNESYAAGVDGVALEHAVNSTVGIAEDPDLDVASFTIEAWVLPGQLPTAGNRMGILDNQNQYGLFLLDTGVVRCTGGSSPTSLAVLQIAEFGHVACTSDGATTTIYVNGAEVSAAGGGGLGNGTDGTRIGADSPDGDELIGRLDNLRFWNVVRTRAQICADNTGACP